MSGEVPYRFLAVRWQRRFVIVPIASIVRIDACDDRVVVVAERSYPHHETLARVCARLAGDAVVRVHRSHAVNVDAIREARARRHGEYALALRDGSVIVSGRAWRDDVEAALRLAHALADVAEASSKLQSAASDADSRSVIASPNGVGCWQGARSNTLTMPRRRATIRLP